MMEFIERCFNLDMGGWIALIMFAGLGYVLFSQMLGDHATAIMGTPFLIAGAVIGNVLFADLGLQLATDKGVSNAANMALGMLVGGVLCILMMCTWRAAISR